MVWLDSHYLFYLQCFARCCSCFDVVDVHSCIADSHRQWGEDWFDILFDVRAAVSFLSVLATRLPSVAVSVFNGLMFLVSITWSFWLVLCLSLFVAAISLNVRIGYVSGLVGIIFLFSFYYWRLVCDSAARFGIAHVCEWVSVSWKLILSAIFPSPGWFDLFCFFAARMPS